MVNGAAGPPVLRRNGRSHVLGGRQAAHAGASVSAIKSVGDLAGFRSSQPQRVAQFVHHDRQQVFMPGGRRGRIGQQFRRRRGAGERRICPGLWVDEPTVAVGVSREVDRRCRRWQCRRGSRAGRSVIWTVTPRNLATSWAGSPAAAQSLIAAASTGASFVRREQGRAAGSLPAGGQLGRQRRQHRPDLGTVKVEVRHGHRAVAVHVIDYLVGMGRGLVVEDQDAVGRVDAVVVGVARQDVEPPGVGDDLGCCRS